MHEAEIEALRQRLDLLSETVADYFAAAHPRLSAVRRSSYTAIAEAHNMLPLPDERRNRVRVSLGTKSVAAAEAQFLTLSLIIDLFGGPESVGSVVME